MITPMGLMVLPSVSRRTLFRFFPTLLLAIISLIALSLLEFDPLESIGPSSPAPAKHHTKPNTGNKHSKDMAAAGSTALKYIAIPARAPHTATIIFSHGLGDTGERWRPVAHMLASQFPHVKWILPHPPEIPITASPLDSINCGMRMPGWFDLYSLGKTDDKGDEEGLIRSSRLITDMVKAENEAGIPNERIVIGGFSQGAALSLVTGVTAEKKYAGIAILSGWLPMRNRLATMFAPEATSTPVFWGHGTVNAGVPYKFGAGSVQLMQGNLGFKDINFKSYQGVGHSADNQEIADLGAWLKRVIPA